MSEFDVEAVPRPYCPTEEQNRSSAEVMFARDHSRSGPNWLLLGLAVAGLGAFAWYSFGPDLVRYMKLRQI
jgi:hypothetical protein